MHRIVIFALFSLSMAVIAAPVAADEPDGVVAESQDSGAIGDTDNTGDTDETSDTNDTSRHFDADHRKRIYESSRLEPGRAILYTLALPGIGNFYAEQYALGTVAMMSMVFTTIFVAFGLLNNHPDLVRVGAGLGAVTYIGSGTAAYLGVQSYNDRLRRSLHIDARRNAPFSSSLNGSPNWTVGWSWRF